MTCAGSVGGDKTCPDALAHSPEPRFAVARRHRHESRNAMRNITASTRSSARRSRLLGLALAGAVAYTAAACGAIPEPSAAGTITDLHLTTAGVDEVCDDSGCNSVPRPDKCYVYVETPDNGFVEAEVWCDAYADLKVGDAFKDGTHVLRSNCAYKDENGRWQGVVGTDECATYSAENDRVYGQ